VQAFDRPKRPRHLPGVLDTAQVRALLRAMRPPYALIAAVLYGAGMRLHECLGVRVKDVDLLSADPTVVRAPAQFLLARARASPRTNPGRACGAMTIGEVKWRRTWLTNARRRSIVSSVFETTLRTAAARGCR
jgi:integrase